jgi:hypothetical protein
MTIQDTDQLPRDLSRTVICMSGFGDKNEAVAIYVSGKLFSEQETRFLDEDEDCYLPLARKFAKELGYRWLKRTAACVWAQHSFATPPRRLEQYPSQTIELFQQISLPDLLDDIGFHPPSRSGGDDEVWRLWNAFVLCGGQPNVADAWVNNFIAAQGGSFVHQHEAAYIRCEARDHDEVGRAESAKVWEQLRSAWRDRVLVLLKADKPRTKHGRYAPRWED